MPRIYHFINATDLASFLSADALRVPSLASEGFIHCSTLDQVIEVANYLAPYSEEMQLLEIDEAILEAEVRYENLEGGEKLFPHVYGPIERSAIVGTYHLDWDGEEGYQLPAELLEKSAI